MTEESDKRIVGLYGEMALSMELHKRKWQVYKAYIDENIDFIIARYYCDNCEGFTELEKREKGTDEQIKERIEKVKSGLINKMPTFTTNCCARCKKDKVRITTRFIQVKTSAGEDKGQNNRHYSFHAKLRSNVGDNSFYAWIALSGERAENWHANFYIFHHTKISLFDDIKIDSYQKTDNQKTTLKFNEDGSIKTKGVKYDYSCFDKFHNNYEILDNGEKRIYPIESESEPSKILLPKDK